MLGYSVEQLAELNQRGVALVQEIAEGHEVVVSGCVGPRGDGYSAESTMTASQAEDYHTFQIRTFAAAGVDMVTALTLTYGDEAVGIVRAGAAADVPVVISFTVETDGRLPSGRIRANASAKSHAELDESDELDEGDPLALAGSYRDLVARMPQLTVLGGCCGTDHRHISAICAARG